MSIPLWLQCNHLQMATSCRIMHHVTKLKSSQTGFFLTWQWDQFTIMASTVTRSLSNRAPLGCGGTGDLHHGCACNCVMLSCQYGPKSLRNVSNTLLNLCHKELRQFWRQKGLQTSTSKVYLIKWPVSVYICLFILSPTHTDTQCFYFFLFLNHTHKSCTISKASE